VCLEKIENEDGLYCSALLFANRDNNIIFLIDAKNNNINDNNISCYLLSIRIIAWDFSQFAIDDTICILDSSLCFEKDWS
jgi:hypothetical protein